jgi:penicillin G amidase
MLSALLFLAAANAPGTIERDAFGVPQIQAPTFEEAFRLSGYAVAQDRLWQMENSRRVARGRMAEAFGRAYAASDRETLLAAYTDEELQRQIDRLSDESRRALQSYVRGINDWMREAGEKGTLPEGYAKHRLEPEPWTELDSAAIAIRLFHQFGRGGAGELRNLAMLTYLEAQPGAKDRALDVLDDFAWQSHPDSPTTLRPEDDAFTGPSPFPNVTQDITRRHLAMIPRPGLLELMPAIRLAERQESTRVAEAVSAPHKAGSYAVVVGPGRSATGIPILLSAPQMGFRMPSVVHEITIRAPGLAMVGMNVPGVPGVTIGYTDRIAWGLTSGVADTDDIFFFPREGDGYTADGRSRPVQTLRRTLRVRGEPDQTVEARRTHLGPVVLQTRDAVFARRSSYWMRELDSFDALAGLWRAESVADVDRTLSRATMSFNFFFALSSGDIGYRYLGLVPVRAEGVDPRFPTPGEARYDWRGMIPPERMPRVTNPKAGLIANWNNRPAAWWANLDTPVWGRIFRVSALFEALDRPRLSVSDVEQAAWSIARREPTWPFFEPFLRRALAAEAPDTPRARAVRYLLAFDGRAEAGLPGPRIYDAFLDSLRQELLAPVTGTFISPDLFRTVAQPSVLHAALLGETRVDYRAGRSADAIVRAAFDRAFERLAQELGPEPMLWRYAPPSIGYPGHPPVPYSDRGTFIQIVETGPTIAGRSVLPPGVAESGPHAVDQIPLARAWTYKPNLPLGGERSQAGQRTE